MSQTLYVVMGQAGEYSDHWTWPVRAFVQVDAARDHVMKATRRAREIAAARHTVPHDDPRLVNEYDTAHSSSFWSDSDGLDVEPDMSPDEGARYYIMEVPLDDDVRAGRRRGRLGRSPPARDRDRRPVARRRRPDMLFEHWRDDGADAFFNADNASARRVLLPTAEKCCEIEASTWTAAMTAYHVHLGREPYVPMDEDQEGGEV